MTGRVKTDIVSRLEQIVGLNRLLTKLEDPLPYSFDATPVLNQLPQAVAFTKTVEEVIAVLKLAHQTKTPVVTRGSGTGLSGGSVPVPGCIVLCTVQMDQILNLDAPNLTMLVETWYDGSCDGTSLSSVPTRRHIFLTCHAGRAGSCFRSRLDRMLPWHIRWRGARERVPPEVNLRKRLDSQPRTIGT
jgi:hypothetical protein